MSPRRGHIDWTSLLGSDVTARVSRRAVKALDQARDRKVDRKVEGQVDGQITGAGVARRPGSREVERMDAEGSGAGPKHHERDRSALRAALGFPQRETPSMFGPSLGPDAVSAPSALGPGAPGPEPGPGDQGLDTNDEAIVGNGSFDLAAGLRRMTEMVESVRSDVNALGRRLEWVEQMVQAQAVRAQAAPDDAPWRRSSGA